MNATVTYIGGPTALIEIGGLRLLTDPTFDAPGTEYPAKGYTLRKTLGPALGPKALGRIDAVLLSHDHHADNLDRSGRALLANLPRVLTTGEGAQRLGGNALGLAPWQHVDLDSEVMGRVRIIATPARHGPHGGDRGPVIGFVIVAAQGAVYVSGDTVWYDGVVDVARRFHVALALLFLGAARVQVAGPAHLTFTAEEATVAARALHGATIAPLHYEGWEHFTESRALVDSTFARVGLKHRLAWLEPGLPRSFELGTAFRRPLAA